MVFESIVADLLNRYLGDYVENLDRKQLKIGIWGGKNAIINFFEIVLIILKKDPARNGKIDFSTHSSFAQLSI